MAGTVLAIRGAKAVANGTRTQRQHNGHAITQLECVQSAKTLMKEGKAGDGLIWSNASFPFVALGQSARSFYQE
jgi:hypothetical protein